MKEASGEANMTVVTIIIIAAIAAIAAPIVTGLIKGTGEKSCEANGGTWSCTGAGANENCSCSY